MVLAADIPKEFYNRHGKLKSFSESQLIQLKALKQLSALFGKPDSRGFFTETEAEFILLSFLVLKSNTATPVQKTASIALLDLLAPNWRPHVPAHLLKVIIERNEPAVIKWRKDCLERDKHSCVECGSEVDIAVHHICSWADFPTMRADIDNGKTLCGVCHHKEHPNMGYGTFAKSLQNAKSR